MLQCFSSEKGTEVRFLEVMPLHQMLHSEVSIESSVARFLPSSNDPRLITQVLVVPSRWRTMSFFRKMFGAASAQTPFTVSLQWPSKYNEASVQQVSKRKRMSVSHEISVTWTHTKHIKTCYLLLYCYLSDHCQTCRLVRPSLHISTKPSLQTLRIGYGLAKLQQVRQDLRNMLRWSGMSGANQPGRADPNRGFNKFSWATRANHGFFMALSSNKGRTCMVLWDLNETETHRSFTYIYIYISIILYINCIVRRHIALPCAPLMQVFALSIV